MADLSDGLFTPAEERQMAVDRVLQEENAVKEREKKETLKWRNYIDTMYGFWTTLDSDFFIATRNLLIRSSEYNPHVDSIATLHEIMHSSNFNAQTYWHIPLMHRNLLLTPRVHREIADMLEDPHKATKELWIANACCQGILSTGDGTREHPYKILRISDEEDIILYLGKKSIAQRTTLFIKKMWAKNDDDVLLFLSFENGHGSFDYKRTVSKEEYGDYIDVITCDDGSVIHFDITATKSHAEPWMEFFKPVETPEIDDELDQEIFSVQININLSHLCD